MSVNLTEFQADLAKAAEDMQKSVAATVKQVALEIDLDVRDHTPVDTGRARDNWFMTLNAPSSDYNAHPGLPHGAAIAPHAPENIDPTGNEPVYIVNNTPYIEQLEAGSSTQAPSGMVELAVQAAEFRIEQNQPLSP
jgi:hypothetical protein